jgi:serine/threonine protein kinase
MSTPTGGYGEIILSSTDPDLPKTPAVGLAKYRNFKAMSRGAHTQLRSCWDPIIGRTIAVKSLLPTAIFNTTERRRFLREARVTAQLQHPNTVPVYEIGDDPQEGLYFTMKRVSGENFFEVLKRIARNEPETQLAFPVSRRLQVVIDACQALSYAHTRGVIHRDVKPENIWVGNFGEVILLDWGVAKVWGHADHEEPIRQSTLRSPLSERDGTQLQTLTVGGQRPGTPLYMSPEQVSGQRAIDERSDIFSVGVVLYEMMAIREPFRGRSVDETFDNILHKTPPLPSERSPDRHVPVKLERITMKAMEKNPADRYQSMRALIKDLETALD